MLVNGKIRYPYKVLALKEKVIKPIVGLRGLERDIKDADERENLNNTNWLAGFVTGDGSFQIKAINRAKNKDKKRIEIRLNLQIDLKYKLLLDQVKGRFGGYVYHRKSQDTYYYGSCSYGVADKLVKYFDKHRPGGVKWIQYIRWRTVWTIIKNREHLKEEGQAKIRRLKIFI